MSEIPDAPPSIGPVAGKYELVRLIGRGGMGTVWEGRHVSLGTRVAIKFIDVEYADSQEARTRFDNEARAAATIQSKHAIQIFDHGVTNDGKPYIVMEMLQGEPLDGRLDRVGRISLVETARILRQVGRALARAHERGIVHRDLKPENIFLVRTPDDDDEIAKVLDFGIAKFKKIDGQSGGLTSSTKTGAVLGTPFYMAPEQARGLRDLDHRVDLWAMGVIAFKCVCGVLPFEGVSVGDLLVKICTTPAPIPSSIAPAAGQTFDAWFQRALEKDPARRFQSALELSDALAGAAGLSVRRGASLSPFSDPGAVSAASNPPSRLARSSPESATSAPFTASSPRAATSSRGLWIASGVAVLTAVLLVLGGLRYYPKAKRDPAPEAAQSGATTASPRAAPTTAGGPATLPIATPQAPLVATAPALTVDAGGVSALDPNEAAREKGQHHHPAPGAHLGAAKPALPGTLTVSNVAATLGPAPTMVAPPPPLPKPAPATKPTSTAVDLGY